MQYKLRSVHSFHFLSLSRPQSASRLRMVFIGAVDMPCLRSQSMELELGQRASNSNAFLHTMQPARENHNLRGEVAIIRSWTYI